MRRFVVWSTTKSEWGTGSWAIIDDSVESVRSAHGSKSTQIGDQILRALRAYSCGKSQANTGGTPRSGETGRYHLSLAPPLLGPPSLRRRGRAAIGTKQTFD
jgi:hypothetical protein